MCGGATERPPSKTPKYLIFWLTFSHLFCTLIPKPTKVKFWENLPKPDLGSAPDSRLYLHSHLSSAGSPLSDSLDSRLSSGPVLDVTR